MLVVVINLPWPRSVDHGDIWFASTLIGDITQVKLHHDEVDQTEFGINCCLDQKTK